MRRDCESGVGPCQTMPDSDSPGLPQGGLGKCLVYSDIATLSTHGSTSLVPNMRVNTVTVVWETWHSSLFHKFCPCAAMSYRLKYVLTAIAPCKSYQQLLFQAHWPKVPDHPGLSCGLKKTQRFPSLYRGIFQLPKTISVQLLLLSKQVFN